MIKMYIGIHVNYPLFASILNFLDRVLKNTKISSFMKIPLVKAEMFYVDGWAQMPKPAVAFRSFANAPKIKKMDCKVKYYKSKNK
jgi:hypothetical protein